MDYIEEVGEYVEGLIRQERGVWLEFYIHSELLPELIEILKKNELLHIAND